MYKNKCLWWRKAPSSLLLKKNSRMSQHHTIRSALKCHFQPASMSPGCHIFHSDPACLIFLFSCFIYVNHRKYAMLESVGIQNDGLGLFPIFCNQVWCPVSKHISGKNNIINRASSEEDRGWIDFHFRGLNAGFVVLQTNFGSFNEYIFLRLWNSSRCWCLVRVTYLFHLHLCYFRQYISRLTCMTSLSVKRSCIRNHVCNVIVITAT